MAPSPHLLSLFPELSLLFPPRAVLRPFRGQEATEDGEPGSPTMISNSNVTPAERIPDSDWGGGSSGPEPDQDLS